MKTSNDPSSFRSRVKGVCYIFLFLQDFQPELIGSTQLFDLCRITFFKCAENHVVKVINPIAKYIDEMVA